jgi:hypothetical protein
MATQTPIKRKATTSKATTRKRNVTNKSAARTKATARRATSAARTSGSSQATAKKSTRTAGRRGDAATARLETVARQAERLVLIPVGVALEARDSLIDAARTYADPRRAKRRLDRFERRGATALRRNERTVAQLRRNQRTVAHKARVTRRDVAERTNGLRSDAEGLVEEVRSII